MSKYKLLWNEEKLQKYVKEGRGNGIGKDYKPWITIHDFPSKGLSSRQPGWKSNRVYHFMSTLELKFFFLLEWSDIVMDIREQFPMDVTETQKIAEKLDIQHPYDRKTKTPYVMTTDFMLTINDKGTERNIARTIKPAIELERENVLEHYQIESLYWKDKGIDFGIITERDLPEILISNIEWVHPFYYLEPTEGLSVSELALLGESLKDRLECKSKKILNIATKFDKEMNLKPGSALYIFKHLVARKEIVLDMCTVHCTASSVDDIKSLVKKSNRTVAL